MDDLRNFENRHGQESDPQLDATLVMLDQVQPPARMEQRIHARLTQEQAHRLRVPTLASFTAAWSWPRAAFATATFTAGVVTATLLYPVLHANRVAPGMNAPTSATSVPATVSTQPAPSKLADVHPAFTVRTPDGRAAALNTMGTVATVRSRRDHSDVQLAANRRDHKSAQAKLTKPVRPAPNAAAPADATDTTAPQQ